MELTNTALLVLALACTLIGVGLVYLSWKSRIQLKEAFCITGWLLVLNACFYWTGLSGWEFGVIFAITVPSLIALLLVASNVESRRPAPRSLPRTTLQAPSMGSLGRFGLRFLLTVPFALVTSVFISFGLGALLLSTRLNEMVFAIVCMPILWGLFAYWTISDTRTLRPVVSISGLCVICILPFLG